MKEQKTSAGRRQWLAGTSGGLGAVAAGLFMPGAQAAALVPQKS